MTVDAAYLHYAHRRAAMDHDRYGRDNVFAREPVRWPGGARVALWLVPLVEFFPLDMPLNVAPGGMTRPYPDYWNYTLRDYGNRVGIYRILRALDERGFRASVAFNSRAAARDRFLVEQVTRRGWELLAMGVDMGRIHQTGVDRATEAAWVEESVGTLRRIAGTPVAGWLSPAMSESFDTPDLVAAAGIEYLCDWMNDDLPYWFSVRPPSGPTRVAAMPHGHEISDLKLIADYGHTASQYAEQVIDYFDFLYREAAEHGGRILSLPMHPWLIGVPHRIGALERILDHVAGKAGVWSATGAEILAAWRGQARERHDSTCTDHPSRR
jgi:peptidoglycan/xylan/chitin deacetylase (PgdA/CDA1 family)